MKAEVETIKKLTADNGKRFIVGSDIAFTLKENNIRYIGTIKKIYNHYMVLGNVEISSNSEVRNGDKIPFDMTVPFEDIKEDSCGYVSVD